MIYLIYLLVFPILLLLMLAEVGNSLSDNASFWAIIALILTFIIDMVRRSIQRRWDKQDREQEKADLKAAIDVAEAKMKAAADLVSRKVQDEAELVKAELELYHKKQELTAKSEVGEIVEILEHQAEDVRELDKKVVTLQVADVHKREVIDAVRENTKRTIENTQRTVEGMEEAQLAYKIANTINEKLKEQQKAGLNRQTDEQSDKNIKEIEDIEQGKI